MKKAAFLILLGSALVAFGFTGHQAYIAIHYNGYDMPLHFGGIWVQASQLEITSGVVLLVWGVLMRLKIEGDTNGKTRK